MVVPLSKEKHWYKIFSRYIRTGTVTIYWICCYLKRPAGRGSAMAKLDGNCLRDLFSLQFHAVQLVVDFFQVLLVDLPHVWSN